MKLGWAAEAAATNGTKVPILFVGGPATAKTSVHHKVTTELGVSLWPINLSRHEPGDFSQPVPMHDINRTRYFVPESGYMPFDEADAKGIVYLDEFDRAGPEMQNASLNFLLDRNFQGHLLHDGVYVTAACNGTSDLYTTALSEAGITRVCSLFVSMHSEGAAECWQEWAEAHDVSPEIIAFRRYNADFIKCHDEDFEELAVCDDRTIVMASAILEAAKHVSFRTDDIIDPMVAGCVGEAAAMRIQALCRLRGKLPSPEDVYRDPENAILPEDPGAMCMAATILVRDAGTDLGRGDAVARWACRMPPEVAAFLLKSLTQAIPNVVTCDAYRRWRDAHKALLI